MADRHGYGRLAALAISALALSGCVPTDGGSDLLSLAGQLAGQLGQGKPDLAGIGGQVAQGLLQNMAPKKQPSPSAAGESHASAAHVGALRPLVDTNALVAGKTLTLEPGLEGTDAGAAHIFFNRSHQAFSEAWSGVPWDVQGNRICFDSATDPRCLTALVDGAGDRFMRGDAGGLYRIAQAQPGDARPEQAAADAGPRGGGGGGEAAKLDALAGLLVDAIINDPGPAPCDADCRSNNEISDRIGRDIERRRANQ